MSTCYKLPRSIGNHCNMFVWSKVSLLLLDSDERLSEVGDIQRTVASTLRPVCMPVENRPFAVIPGAYFDWTIFAHQFSLELGLTILKGPRDSKRVDTCQVTSWLQTVPSRQSRATIIISPLYPCEPDWPGTVHSIHSSRLACLTKKHTIVYSHMWIPYLDTATTEAGRPDAAVSSWTRCCFQGEEISTCELPDVFDKFIMFIIGGVEDEDESEPSAPWHFDGALLMMQHLFS